MKKILFALFLLCLFTFPARAMEVKISVSNFRPHLLGKYMAENLLDDDTETVWASSALNNGAGSWFEISFKEPVALKDLTIYNGHQGGQFRSFTRIHTGRFIFSDGSEQHFELKDVSGPQKVECWTVPTTEITVQVDSVYPENPDPKESLAVSEIKFTIIKGQDGPVAQAEGGVLGELAAVVRDFYAKQTTLDDDFLKYIPKARLEDERFGFEVFKQMQMQQGTYETMKQSVIDASMLEFRLMYYKDGTARVHSFGHYEVFWHEHVSAVPDDSVFTLIREDGQWKVDNIRDYATVE